MTFVNQPRKDYRLFDGTKATEYEALVEMIAHQKKLLQEREDCIEELQRRLMTAEGRPPV